MCPLFAQLCPDYTAPAIQRLLLGQAPSYIKALLLPNGNKPAGRRVWSIDLEAVWLPFFTATNTAGDTQIPHEALGAPLRLAYAPDGEVKFSKAGRPVVKVVKEIGDCVRMVRENFTAGLLAYAGQIASAMPDEYKAQVGLAREAGQPILNKDRKALEDTLLRQAEAVIAQAQAQAPKGKAKGKVKELVTA